MAQANATKGATALFDALKLNADGRVVRASLSLPSTEFEKLLSGGGRGTRRPAPKQ
jgi:hypothetical protein